MTEEETWRRRGAAMAALLRADLPDADWNGAMRVLAHVGLAAKCPAAAMVAKRAVGAGGGAMQGLAVRRAAMAKLAALYAVRPQAARAA